MLPRQDGLSHEPRPIEVPQIDIHSLLSLASCGSRFAGCQLPVTLSHHIPQPRELLIRDIAVRHHLPTTSHSTISIIVSSAQLLRPRLARMMRTSQQLAGAPQDFCFGKDLA